MIAMLGSSVIYSDRPVKKLRLAVHPASRAALVLLIWHRRDKKISWASIQIDLLSRSILEIDVLSDSPPFSAEENFEAFGSCCRFSGGLHKRLSRRSRLWKKPSVRTRRRPTRSRPSSRTWPNSRLLRLVWLWGRTDFCHHCLTSSNSNLTQS